MSRRHACDSAGHVARNTEVAVRRSQILHMTMSCERPSRSSTPMRSTSSRCSIAPSSPPPSTPPSCVGEPRSSQASDTWSGVPGMLSRSLPCSVGVSSSSSSAASAMPPRRRRLVQNERGPVPLPALRRLNVAMKSIALDEEPPTGRFFWHASWQRPSPGRRGA